MSRYDYESNLSPERPIVRKRHGCFTLLLVLACIGSGLNAIQGFALALWVIINYVQTGTVLLSFPTIPSSVVQRGTSSSLSEATWNGMLTGVSQSMSLLTPSVVLIVGMIGIIEIVACIAIWNWKRWGLYLILCTASINIALWLGKFTHTSPAGGVSMIAIELFFVALFSAFVLANWKMYE